MDPVFIDELDVRTVLLSQTPYFEYCGEGESGPVYVGTNDREGKLISFFSLLPNEEEESHKYVGCVGGDLYRVLNQSADVTTIDDAYVLYREDEDLVPKKGPILSGANDNLDIRMWDLGRGCHTQWSFKGGTGLPTGILSGNSIDVVALFCTNEESCNLINIDDSSKNENNFSVDRFYKKSMCIRANKVTPPDVLIQGGFYNCTQLCSEEEATFIQEGNASGDGHCFCGSLDLIDAGPNVQINDNCNPCEDAPGSVEDPHECGSGSFFDPMYSVYVKDSAMTNYGYKYFQCMTDNLTLFSNPPAVLPDDSYFFADMDSPRDCFQTCNDEELDLVMMMSIEDSSQFGCFCTSSLIYRFRMQDLHPQCTEFWCPGIQGPCVSGFNTDPHSAVYCKGEFCNADLIMPNDQSGVCEHMQQGFKVKYPAIGRKNESAYLECNYLKNSDLWLWEDGFCPLGEVFSGVSGGCSVKVCEATDARGIEWVAAPGKFAVQECGEGINGKI